MATNTIAIANLPVLPPNAVIGNDILPIVDVSDLTDPGGTTKQVTVDALSGYAVPQGNGRTVSSLQSYLANNAVFNVLDFATPGTSINTGSTALVDDAGSAIQAAIQAATNAGGGKVYLPAGTYGFQIPLGIYKIFLRPRNNVWICGDGVATILRAGNGLNTATANLGFNFIRHVILDESITSVSNVIVSDLVFDHNGTNNLIPAGFTSKDNVAIGIQAGNNIWIDRCWFTTNAGKQTLSFGNNVSPQSVANLFIRDNLFTEMGGSVTGNTNSVDHSSIYAQTIGGEINGNRFVNANAPLNNTALEIHAQEGSVSDNHIANYNTAMNLVATVSDFKHMVIEGNTAVNVNIACNIYQSGANIFDIVRVSNNIFSQYIAAANNFVLMSNVSTGIASIVFTDNTFRSTIPPAGAGVIAAIEIGLANRFEIRGNRFSGFPGRAIQLATITSGMILTIEDNIIQDCGTTTTSGNKQAVALNNATTIGYLSLRRNKALNVASAYMTSGFIGNAPVTQGTAADNETVGITTPYQWNATTGIISVDNGTSAPSTGNWALGCRRTNTNPSEAGSASSKYVIDGWVCTSAGAPGTWLQRRTLTGN